MNDLLFVLLGLLIAALVIRLTTQGMNVPRVRKNNTQDVLHYEDMTDEELHANGFIPMDKLSPGWQAFHKKSKEEREKDRL